MFSIVAPFGSVFKKCKENISAMVLFFEGMLKIIRNWSDLQNITFKHFSRCNISWTTAAFLSIGSRRNVVLLCSLKMSCPKRRKIEQSDIIAPTYFHPILPDELVNLVPLTDVYVDTIMDTKNISRIVVELNKIFPIPELAHLKRIKGLDVLLVPCNRNIDECTVYDRLKNANFDTAFLKNNIKRVSVAEIAPKTRRQYEIVHQLWPCNFHSNKYVEKLCTNTLFSSSEIENHITYMKIAIDVARYSNSEARRTGAVIVDPKLNSIVAVGYDKRDQNPCDHTVMVAVENVALSQSSDDLHKNLDVRGIPEEVLKDLTERYPSVKFGAAKFKGKNEILIPSDGPYLCTGYTVYTTQEPCVMCAMALIHSRAKRVFYGVKNEKGGLGTLCKVHTIKDLNHHYEVFAGLLEDECSKLL